MSFCPTKIQVKIQKIEILLKKEFKPKIINECFNKIGLLKPQAEAW